MPIGPSIAHAEYEIRFEEGCIAVAMAGLEAYHSCHQVMIIGDRTPAHKRRDNWNASELGELDKVAACVGIDNPAASHDQRPLGSIHHLKRALGLRCRRRRLVNGQGFVRLDVVFDLGCLNVDRQVDQYWARTARAHHMECPLGMKHYAGTRTDEKGLV